MANNWPDWLPIRNNLRGLSPYGAPQIDGVISLNTNENPFELPEPVISQMLEQLPDVLRSLNRYPDRDALELRKSLAKYINNQSRQDFSVSNIWAANGSNEILQTLMLACGQNGALGFLPSYSVHPLIAEVLGVTWTSASRNPDFTLDIPAARSQIIAIKPSLTFVTTPNNPTGTVLRISEIEELAKACAQISGLLIVDEAYAEFSSETSAVTLISKYPNIVVVRTMSKAFAFAGARLGYLIANPAVIEACLVTRLPYHLSSVTQGIAIVALANAKLLQSEVDLLIAERSRVTLALESLGFKVSQSSANFLLFSGFQGQQSKVWQDLVDGGILIRDNGITGFLRVTIGTPAENDQFLAAIARHKP